jgi:hypothetical protein
MPPLASSATIESPTLAVSLHLSAFMAVPILHFILHATSCQMRLFCRRDACLAISRHVPLLIQSVPGVLFGFGLTHLAANASNAVVYASFGPGSRDSRNFRRLHRYWYCLSWPLSLSDYRNNGTVIQVEEPQETEPNSLKNPPFLCTCQDIIRLLVVLRRPPFLAPPPSRPGSGPA